MTTFYLVRHGENDVLGYGIAGRRPGIHLNELGRKQAEEVARPLALKPIRHIFSSPLERAFETAEPLAKQLRLEIQKSEALTEADFGDWTGKSFEELNQDERWRNWNTFRSGSRMPGGDAMLDVQARIVGQIESLRRAHPEDSITLFTHGDPIRAALTYYLGMPLDLVQRIGVSTASVSVISIDDWAAQVKLVNATLSGLP